jgi:ZIP family zinc transporter
MLVISIVPLVCTFIGALIGILFKKPNDKLLGTLSGFAGGIMLSLVIFDMTPEILKTLNYATALFFCLIGILIANITDLISNSIKPLKNNNIKVALMLGIAFMLSNIPEGFVMGCGLLVSATLGTKVSLVISMQDIPEGMLIATPLVFSNVKVSKVLFFTFFMSLPTIIGIWLGAYIGSVSSNILIVSLSIATGIILYVIFDEMISQSLKCCGKVSSSISMLSGILSGLIFTIVA